MRKRRWARRAARPSSGTLTVAVRTALGMTTRRLSSRCPGGPAAVAAAWRVQLLTMVPRTCQRQSPCHLEKNATQTAAISWQLRPGARAKEGGPDHNGAGETSKVQFTRRVGAQLTVRTVAATVDGPTVFDMYGLTATVA